MLRRTLLQSIAAVLAARPLRPFRLFAQAPPLTDANVATIGAIAEVVLPAAIGRAGREQEVARFVAWVRNYKEGADTGYGYGNSRLSQPTGPSPAARYPPQFAALDEAARAQGAATFAALPLAARRPIVEAALNTPQPVNAMPARPSGANLVADVMGFYFASPAANDLCYQAQIRRDQCRSIEGADQAPAPLPPQGGR